MTEAMLRSRGVARLLWLCVVVLGVASCQHPKTGDAGAEAAVRTYASICARCHGSDGKGGVPAAEGSNAPRNFCDASFQKSRTDEQLKQAIRQGKGAMPAFGNLFDEQALQGLVREIRKFTPALESH